MQSRCVRKFTSLVCGAALMCFLGAGAALADVAAGGEELPAEPASEQEAETTTVTIIDNVALSSSDRAYIEENLDLANNTEYTWSYQNGAWVMSVVSAVAYPEIPSEEGVSVCVPAAYVIGIDTDGNGEADITADTFTGAVNGALVIDYDAEVISSNGQIYSASTAPVILNTGAAGYSSQTSSQASTQYASEGYINVSCGNRGKQDTATDADGNTYYTGDAPSCLADQKAAARFVKYNILLGNLPGNVDYFVSTGGSGGGAHAVMFAATSDNPDFYPYEAAVGAVGVYLNEDGTYSSSVTIDGQEVELSDGAWGCIAYSPITSLYEGDMTLAFEYYLDTDYSFGSSFQKQLAAYLSEAYMDYINGQDLTVDEAAVGFDLDGDGELNSTIALTIEYDPEAYADTNGYGGSYLDLYLAEFISDLQWYLDNLDYTEGWTWFDADGNALSDEAVAAMSTEDKAEAFIEGRYASGSSTGMGGEPGGAGGMGGEPGGAAGGEGGMAGEPGGAGGGEPADVPDSQGSDRGPGDEGMQPGDQGGTGAPEGGSAPDQPVASVDSVDAAVVTPMADVQMGEPGGDVPGGEMGGQEVGGPGESTVPDEPGDMGAAMETGGPEAGTTQAAGSRTDSANYATYDEMVEAYAADIAEIEAGDIYGNNIVDLYDPLNYIGAEGTEDPTWVRMVMGAQEGDMSLFASLNLQIAWLNAGTDCEIEWQWNGGHVPSEIFSNSFSLYVDEMYAEYAGGVAIETPEAEPQTTNGSATSPTGTDISGWVDASDIDAVTFTLADIAAYRTSGASKAMPGFDVIDYGQEDYVFGSTEKDARHWDTFVLEILQTYADTLSELFNAG